MTPRGARSERRVPPRTVFSRDLASWGRSSAEAQGAEKAAIPADVNAKASAAGRHAVDRDVLLPQPLGQVRQGHVRAAQPHRARKDHVRPGRWRRRPKASWVGPGARSRPKRVGVKQPTDRRRAGGDVEGVVLAVLADAFAEAQQPAQALAEPLFVRRGRRHPSGVSR
jgi:hypothetical protein